MPLSVIPSWLRTGEAITCQNIHLQCHLGTWAKGVIYVLLKANISVNCGRI